MTTTFATVLTRVGVTVPDETIAELAIPLIGMEQPQRQGDVAVVPLHRELSALELEQFTPIPANGLTVAEGDNRHVLLAEPGSTVMWRAGGGDMTLLGTATVDGTAWLIHTDEHGVNGIGPGCYTVHGKREQAEEIRRVAD